MLRLALSFFTAAALALAGCQKQTAAPVNPTRAAARLPWTEDYESALARAKAEGKLVLLDFTGSDWCGLCIVLGREVFSTPEFAAYAEKNLVLVELDFTQQGETKSTAFGRIHETLALKYVRGGFPTVVLVNPEGVPLGSLGYQPGGPQAFIAALEKLKGK